ncbi:MAG: SPOR domain-containing protein, partial [Pseudomonadota bacterium]
FFLLKRGEKLVGQRIEAPAPPGPAKVEPEKEMSPAPSATIPPPSAEAPSRAPAVEKEKEIEEKREVEAVRLRQHKIEFGDCLWDIAAKEEVFGDPWEWWHLLKFNRKVVKSTYKRYGRWYAVIPTGGMLEIPSREEISKVDKEERKVLLYPWAVQVLSRKSYEEVRGALDKIRKEGYPAYITSIVLNKEKWYRLRIGFYPTRKEAQKVGEEVVTDFGMEGFWTVLPNGKEIKAHFRS